MLEEKPHIENESTNRGNEHRLAQADFFDELGRDGEGENQESEELKRSADLSFTHEGSVLSERKRREKGVGKDFSLRRAHPLVVAGVSPSIADRV